MRGVFLLLAALSSSPALAAGKSGGEKLIYKVDSVIATIHQQRIVIQAKGAVLSGGWKDAKLRVVRSPADPHALVVDFEATPPPANASVVQGLLPVSANTVVPMRKGVVTVRVVTDANEMTSQILKH